MCGKLYGIGVGPGDPELLTIKALRIMRESDVIAVPGEVAEKSVAYQIAEPVFPSIKDKEVAAIPMPMTKDKNILDKNYKAAADIVEEYLKEGRQVSFLTLGDPTIYSTFMYVHQRIIERGYETEIVSGIPSFCAAAARLGIGAAERSQELHIIPASYQIEAALDLPGTKILMKAGRKSNEVKKLLLERATKAVMIENCGMSDEKIYETTEAIPETAGYYSLIIVKE